MWLMAMLLFTGVEARTPHFRVVTLQPPETAAAAATALERTRARFLALGFRLPPGATEVVLFRDPEEIRPYAPDQATGFFQQATDASYIAVTWDRDGMRELAHELAHQAMASRIGLHPPWLREGLAELLSNLEPVPGGLVIGAPIAAHLRGPQPDFYARSWLLAHRLVVGSGGPLPARLEALQIPPGLPDQVSQKLPAEVLPLASPLEEPPVPAIRLLNGWEYEYRLAELWRGRSLTAQARGALVSLRVRFPDRPEPAESLGAIEMDAFRYDQAEEWFAEAVRLGSVNASTHYRYSLLLMRPGRDAEAAARHARRAVELDPERPLHWLARAQAEMQLSRWDAARSSLEQMRARTEEPLLVEQVRIELAEVDRRREQQLRPPPKPAPPEVVVTVATLTPPVPPVASPPARLPASPPARQPWPPPGTLTFWGYVRGVECSQDQKILTVSNSRFAVRVRERSGAPARLVSPPAKIRRLPCSLKDVEVNVVYRPAADFGPLNGELVAVLF